MKRSNTITQRVCRAFAGVTTAAVPLLSTGCVNVPDETATQLLQSISDGLTSAVASLVEVAFLVVAI
jgi:hypothetical protein